MISPSHVSVYNMRREDLLSESAREQLIAQAYQQVPTRRHSRGDAPALLVTMAVSAIAGWLASLG